MNRIVNRDIYVAETHKILKVQTHCGLIVLICLRSTTRSLEMNCITRVENAFAAAFTAVAVASFLSRKERWWVYCRQVGGKTRAPYHIIRSH